jgi:hypothetical protein
VRRQQAVAWMQTISVVSLLPGVGSLGLGRGARARGRNDWRRDARIGRLTLGRGLVPMALDSPRCSRRWRRCSLRLNLLHLSSGSRRWDGAGFRRALSLRLLPRCGRTLARILRARRGRFPCRRSVESVCCASERERSARIAGLMGRERQRQIHHETCTQAARLPLNAASKACVT